MSSPDPHHPQNEQRLLLLAACAAGDLSRVQQLYQTLSSSTSTSTSTSTTSTSTTSTPAADHALLLSEMTLKAAEKGHAEIVRFCLERGANADDYELVNEASEFPEVFKVLVTVGGLDVNYDFEGAGDMLINAVWERKHDFVRWLLEHGADPNSGHLMADSTSAMTAAAERGDLDLAELLLKYGAKVSGTGALPGAADKGLLHMVDWLIDHDADLDEVGVHDYGDRRKAKLEGTALHKAVAKGNVDLARRIVYRGGRIDVEDPMGRTPLMRAKEENQEQAVRYLESIGVIR